MKVAIILISESSLPIARTLSNEFLDSEIITTTLAPDCTYVSFYEEFMALSFHRYDAFIFIGAMGICVRTIAPHVKDKHTDPAVICVDSTGRYAVSVLSGHIGKANEMTENIAHILGAEPVITTQSDRTGLWALDTLGDKFDWTAIPGETEYGMMNNITSLFVKKVPTALFLEVRDQGTEYLEKTCPPHVDIHYGLFRDVDLSRYQLVILVTPFLHNTHDTPALFYVPKVLHVGVGLAHQAGPVHDIVENILGTMINSTFMPRAVKYIATINEKRNEPVIKELERAYQIRYYSAEELKEISVPNPSPVVEKHMGTPSVSEAAAFLSANGGKLLLDKQKGGNYTMAIAIEEGVLRYYGHIEIVGAGPGDPDLISVRGRQMLEKADLILYAGSLVPRELTFCAKPGATVRSSASMDLEEQFALMKKFYDEGKFIVRLHTGDPCIYGAIQEQMNYFDQHHMSYHITPGISSFQAAAAALKSQFTIPEKVQSIILTRGEGRTPMPEREQLHLLARSQSTMCIFLSAGIAEQVQEELLQEYPETTPVAVCYHLTWKDERIYRGELKDLAKIVKENNLTLTTMIVVGEAIDNREGLSRLYAHEFKHLFRR
jgi:precorrin-4 C11-methyltransferase